MLNVADIFGLNFNGLANYYNIFIICITVFWLTLASVQDFKRREVENWWSFSLIIFVMAFRAFLSIERGDYWLFLWGLIGLLAGFIIANLLYYGRMFAGGDFKLLIALFCVIPLSLSWKINLFLLLLFFVLIIFGGGLYGIVYTFILMITNYDRFKKEFLKQLKKYKKSIYANIIFVVFLLILFLILRFHTGIILCLLIFISPMLLIFAKSVENSCLIKLVGADKLTIGDWLAEPVRIKVNKKIKTIKPDWEGLSEEELNFIKRNIKGMKNKKVLIKEGIPFVPAFLLAFLILIIAILL
jgi:Flp pilus assembly protein protease CpaA